MLQIKKETANIWEYKVGNIANFVRLWKTRMNVNNFGFGVDWGFSPIHRRSVYHPIGSPELKSESDSVKKPPVIYVLNRDCSQIVCEVEYHFQ